MDSKNHFTPGRSHTVSNPPSVLTSTATFVTPGHNFRLTPDLATAVNEVHG